MGFGNADQRTSRHIGHHRPNVLDCVRLAIRARHHLYESAIQQAANVAGLWTRYCLHQLALQCSGPAGGIPRPRPAPHVPGRLRQFEPHTGRAGGGQAAGPVPALVGGAAVMGDVMGDVAHLRKILLQRGITP